MKAFRYFVLFAITALFLGVLIQSKADALSGNGGGSGSSGTPAATATPLVQIGPFVSCTGTQGASKCGSTSAASTPIGNPLNFYSTNNAVNILNGSQLLAMILCTGSAGGALVMPSGWAQVGSTVTDGTYEAFMATKTPTADEAVATYSFGCTSNTFSQGIIVQIPRGFSVQANGVGGHACGAGTTCTVSAPTNVGTASSIVVTFGFNGGGGTCTPPTGEFDVAQGGANTVTNGYCSAWYAGPANSTEQYSFGTSHTNGTLQAVID